MKYTSEVTINLPREKVIELFDSVENLKKWQPGLESFEAISGTPGQPGAKSRLVYDMNGRKIEMVETVTSRNLPDEFSGTYEADGVFNRIANRFYDVNGKTRWVTENEFTFTTLMMKLMGLLMPFMFRRQTQKDMNRFKDFAESTDKQ